MELKKVKNKNQETDGYGRDKRPKTEKRKRKEVTITEKLEKKLKQKKAARQSGYPWNQSEEVDVRVSCGWRAPDDTESVCSQLAAESFLVIDLHWRTVRQLGPASCARRPTAPSWIRSSTDAGRSVFHWAKADDTLFNRTSKDICVHGLICVCILSCNYLNGIK